MRKFWYHAPIFVCARRKHSFTFPLYELPLCELHETKHRQFYRFYRDSKKYGAQKCLSDNYICVIHFLSRQIKIGYWVSDGLADILPQSCMNSLQTSVVKRSVSGEVLKKWNIFKKCAIRFFQLLFLRKKNKISKDEW